MSRTPKKIVEKKLRAALKQAEKDGPLDSQQELWKATAEIYNDSGVPDEISPSHVYTKVRELNIRVKTKGKKGKRSIKIDRPKLEAAIKKAEAKGPLANRSALFEKVAEIYNATKGIPAKIKPPVVYLRVRDWGLEENLKTPKGKRDGAHLHSGPRKPRVSRAEKFEAKGYQDCFKAIEQMLAQNEATSYNSLLERIKKGSAAAAIKLHCLECCGFMTKEVRLCGNLCCPMYPFRPYQNMTDEQIEQDNEKDNEPENEEEAA